MELLNQMDGFDQNVNVKVRPGPRAVPCCDPCALLASCSVVPSLCCLHKLQSLLKERAVASSFLVSIRAVEARHGDETRKVGVPQGDMG